jgi:hypothetical protein
MKQRVEEMEQEAKKLRELQEQAEQSASGTEEDPNSAMDTSEGKDISDSKSVYVGNVRFSCQFFFMTSPEI